MERIFQMISERKRKKNNASPVIFDFVYYLRFSTCGDILVRPVQNLPLWFQWTLYYTGNLVTSYVM